MDQHRMKKKLAAALRYSYTRLALNYYAYFEAEADRAEAGEEPSPKAARFREEFQRILNAYLTGDGDLEGLESLRRGVMEEMEVLTAYTDCFQVYEHVLNRQEAKFLDLDHREPLAEDPVLTAEIMEFFRQSRDSAVMNERIQLVMEQLPIRFTKAKFFSLVDAGLSLYKGGQRSSLEGILYMIRSGAMLELPKHMEEGHGELWDLLELFRGADYKALTKDQFENLSNGLRLATDRLLDASGEWLLAMDLINDLYVLHLSRDGAVMEASEEQELIYILDAVWKKLEAEDYAVAEEEANRLLDSLVGRQERYYEKWLRLEGEIPEAPADEAERETARRLGLVELLLSGSPFVELDREEETELLDEETFQAEERNLFDQLEELFAGMPRAVIRAVMARTLSSLPVCFNSIGEVEAYVANSLGSCADLGEKTVSMDLIRSIMLEGME